jgi:hypothetical protein
MRPPLVDPHHIAGKKIYQYKDRLYCIQAAYHGTSVNTHREALVDVLTALGLAVPAGLNAYIPLLAVALAERFAWLELRPPFDVLGSWWMIAIIAVLLAFEIVADKVPGVDHANDVVQSIIRPASGAIVAVAASGSGSSVKPWVLVLVGVLLAGGVHAVKATARPVVNTTTAGIGAPAVSTVEDISAAVICVVAIVVPVLVVFLIAGLFVALWWVWRRRRRERRSTAEPWGE